MIIKPPDEYDGMDIEVYPQQQEIGFTKEQYEAIKQYQLLKCWMCPICQTKNSHDNRRCVYCWIRFQREVPKP